MPQADAAFEKFSKVHNCLRNPGRSRVVLPAVAPEIKLSSWKAIPPAQPVAVRQRFAVVPLATLPVKAVIVKVPWERMFPSSPNSPPVIAEGSAHSPYWVDPGGGVTVPPFTPLSGGTMVK